ncbi:MAG: A24 family peptidase [Chloroflexi bacterium]|nr:A24 family peptidase [Chloroflexota bacterium]
MAARAAPWCAAGGGLVALGAAALGGVAPAEAAYVAVFGGVFVLLAWLDLGTRTIPNAIVYPVLVLALGLSPSEPGPGLAESLAGGLVALAAWSAIRALSRGGLGGGDVKMAALVGAVVGLPGIVAASALTAMSAGLVAGALLLTRTLRPGDALPYGPFLAFGGLVGLVW